MRSPTLALTCELIERESVTPRDAGCQALLAARLAEAGFTCEPLRYGEVSNLWAWRGTSGPTLAFAGHIDVVPPGPLEAWQTPPFTPSVRDGLLFGRGAADMKGGVAAMVIAGERFAHTHPQARGRLAFLFTSDEEGVAVDGTARVVETLRARGETIDWCLVGEPSCVDVLGDTMRNGRRGSLGGTLRVNGEQGHIAYPHLADNPIHRLGAIIADLTAETWDSGNDYFPPTSFQVSGVSAGTGAENIIPGHADMQFNFRFNSSNTREELEARTQAIVARHAPDHVLSWRLSGQPFLTPVGELTEALAAAVTKHTGQVPRLSTDGGTSDGRFIAQMCKQVVEFGAINASIHKLNEHVRIDDLDVLCEVYYMLMCGLLPDGR